MHHSDTSTDYGRLAVGLGCFSVALGVAELAAPSQVARLIGAPDSEGTRNTLRLFGAREVASGLAILTQPQQSSWLWSRVGGDAIDLAWLASMVTGEGSRRGRLNAAAAAVAGVAVLDVLAAGRLRDRDEHAWPARRHRGVRINRAITINRTIDDVYAFWRNVTNFPKFMRHLREVELLDDRRSRWRAVAPAGFSVEWEAEVVQDRSNEWIAWRSLPGSQVENSGSVRFAPAPGARGTEVRVQLEYAPPAGSVGRAIAWMFGEEPEQQIRDDLRRFKQLMETGEIPVSDAPGLWRAAQPTRRAQDIRKFAGVNE